MTLYTTVFQEASAEQVIEKSRFIAYVRPVSSREEAEDFLERIRRTHKDATHVVPAFILGPGQEVKWMSDDGEPQGTAGAPVLGVLEREGLTNVACAVVRYFGGKLLGTGGLVHAYGSSAKTAFEAAGKATMEQVVILHAEFEYTFLSKIQNREREGLFRLSSPSFGEKVRCEFLCKPEDEARVTGDLTEMTSGTVSFLERKTTESLQKSR